MYKQEHLEVLDRLTIISINNYEYYKTVYIHLKFQYIKSILEYIKYILSRYST